ncbi:cupin domain-containing protein [Burkholderia sp. 22PA0099]|uniref:cupin domain-containing protein n=1 Tax=Burkholderia sp. 22PA0099 TaxID=3237372 RepID=UPI0039C0EBDD
MSISLIEHAWIDLSAAPQAPFAITPLSDADAPCWSGVLDLGPGATHTLDAGLRHDLFVLQGEVMAGGQHLATGDFLTRCHGTVVRAGEGGARVLLYRQACNTLCQPLLQPSAGRVWHGGINPHMRIAPLAGGRHHVSLVAWQPQARTRAHAHPSGEEMFVLSGVLRDGERHHPAGTWLRLHPGAEHAPFADEPAVILLRHGHLPDTKDRAGPANQA